MKKQYLVIDTYGEGGNFFDSMGEAIEFARKKLDAEYIDDSGYKFMIYRTEKIAEAYIPAKPEPVIDWIDTTA